MKIVGLPLNRTSVGLKLKATVCSGSRGVSLNRTSVGLKHRGMISMMLLIATTLNRTSVGLKLVFFKAAMAA